MKSMKYVVLAMRSVRDNGFPNVAMCETIRQNLYTLMRTEIDREEVKILDDAARLFTGAILGEGNPDRFVPEAARILQRAMDRRNDSEPIKRAANLEALDSWLKSPHNGGAMIQAQAVESLTNSRVHAARIGFIAGYDAALAAAKRALEECK